MTQVDLRLAVTDMPVADLPVYAKCPGHKDTKRPNLAVYDDHLHCYVCGFHRNLRPPVASMETHEHPLAILLGVTNEEALALEARYSSESLDAYRERAATEARRDPMPTALAQVYNQVLMQGPRKGRMDWLLARGLTRKTIGDNLIGHDGNRFVIPVFDADANLISLRFRRDDEYLDDGYPKYSGVKGRNGLYLYPEDLIEREERRMLVICEGELDALRLWQDNIAAISPTNGAGQVVKLPKLIRERWPSVATLLLATDQDEAGEAAAMGHTNEKGKFVPGAAQAALELGFKVYRLKWEGGKDVSEALQLGTLDSKHLGRYATAVR